MNGTHRLPDALAPLINVRRGAEGDKQTPNVTKCHQMPGTFLPYRTDDQEVRIVAVNGTHRLADALAPLINVRRGAEGDTPTPNVTKCLT